MAFVTTSDFTGKFEIHTNGTQVGNLQDHIDRYEDYYLKRLFGLELYTTWKASVESVTPDPIYTFLRDPFDYQEDYELIQSRGVVDMLLGLIYFEYQKDVKTQATTQGGVKLKQNVSKKAQTSYMSSRWNESISTYKAIQKYIECKSDIYPEYKGVKESYSIFGGL